MKILKVVLFVLLVGVMNADGQIVTISPTFPKRTEEITITYDATQGNKGLQGVAQVYAHTGLIVEGKNGWQYVQGNWGTDDARVKMTSIGNNKHTLKVKINDFYKVPASEKITQLAFVFRNVNGSREGKTANNQDIFVPFTENTGVLSANLISPAEKSFIINPGTIIPIKVNASKVAKQVIRLNDAVIHEVTTAALDYSLNVTTTGTQRVSITVGEGTEALQFSFSFTTTPVVTKKTIPEGILPGANISDKITLLLAAPDKQYVHLLSNANDWSVDNAYAMNQSPDGNYWWITIDKPSGKHFMYQYLTDGKIKVADPHSTLVLDDVNDRFLPPSPDLPAYPTDKTNGILSLINLDNKDFIWTDQSYKKPKKERLNIYELLMRDFVSTRNYGTLTDTLNYLQKLGINAIELMPVQEFEGNQSWGYNPSYHMALDKAYGSPEQFKKFVNEAHKRGIAVIIDVVFNHAFSQSPLVQMYWDAANSRPLPSSPYANTQAKHPFNVGFDLNHESSYVKSWMDRVLAYWMKEYHIDGFRFDLSKGFTQNASSDNGQFSNYDASRVAILKRLADQIRKTDPEAIIILEHFANNNEEQELANYGMLLWANFGFNFNEGTMGYVENGKSNINNLDYSRRGWNLPHQIAYMESHDEERLYYKNSQFGNILGAYNTRDKNTALQRIAAAAHTFLSVPGPKMIWQFGELGYEYSINSCPDGTVNENCRLSEKPIRWDYLQDENRMKLYQAFASMHQLRNRHEVFHTKNFILDGQNGYKVTTLINDTLNAVILSNLEMTNATKLISFPHSGTWYEYYSNTSINVTGTPTLNISLDPGEYRIYFDKKITSEGTITHVDRVADDEVIHIYPNPATNKLFINSAIHQNIAQVEIYQLTGQRLGSYLVEMNSIELPILPSGIYLLKIYTRDRIISRRISIK